MAKKKVPEESPKPQDQGNAGKLPRGQWLTVKEMAKKSGLAVPTVYHMIETRTLPWPCFPVAATKKVADSADIDDWLMKIRIPAGKK
jgi:predicted DNA-binding transcriptional regulator AlpA